jgi:predicted nucleic acid-binding protein
MTRAIVDTTVILHLFRRYAPALAWYSAITMRLGVTSITWIEVLYGAGSKSKLNTCKTILAAFDLQYLTTVDQDWAISRMEQYRLSHGVATNDCLIAAVAARLQVPLYTHNLKDMTSLIGSLAVKPYS